MGQCREAWSELRRCVLNNSDSDGALNMIAFGVSGTGKSETFINLFQQLGIEKPPGFVAKCSLDAVTSDVVTATAYFDGVMLHATDVPGVYGAAKSESEPMTVPKSRLSENDVCLVVMRADERMTQPMCLLLRSLVQMLGTGFVQKLVFVLTRADHLDASQKRDILYGSSEGKTRLRGFYELIEEILGHSFPRERVVLMSNKGDDRAASVARLLRAMTATVSIPRWRRIPLCLPTSYDLSTKLKREVEEAVTWFRNTYGVIVRVDDGSGYHQTIGEMIRNFLKLLSQLFGCGWVTVTP